ncbi:hypothetical protein [Paenibacillus albus]|uniref:Membrane transport protein MMPL domain-containing protein n=1 Tax=Paenibacillus albus TaxID=2495582 RepID=A0A3Q8X6B5_9BACL|nr:hypothetical protein [Paenibacillus albus]AZN41522.1 hypothetical protein EJC50_18945 [Paenibacillus albus]
MIDLFGIAEPAPIFNVLPILVAGILFGLAMDYEVFLVSGMREKYVHSGCPKDAILHGIASFIFAEDTIVKSMGLASLKARCLIIIEIKS